MFYFVKTPWLLKKLYPSLIWHIPVNEKELYLTFDDGPHPVVTPFVLDELRKYKAKATFFCIGKNVVSNLSVYQQILNEGHQVGNHTFNHVNGWKASNRQYFDDILEAEKYIDSRLFRPPYGRITRFQAKYLQQVAQFRIIMYTVLSGDFDESLTPGECMLNISQNIVPGSIIVFHDSQKAFPRLKKVLPAMLRLLSDRGYYFNTLPSAKL